MLDLIASCDQSFRDGLRVREKQALSPSCLDSLKQHVYYDPTSESGLRWATALHSRNGRGHNLGDAIGKNFFIGKYAYQSSSIVLILNDIWPEDGQNVVTRKDPDGSWADVVNLEWAFHGDSRSRNAELTRVALIRSILGHDGPDLGDRLRLNAPCRKGHLWNGHQLGLQRKSGQSWRCDECQKDLHSTPEKIAYQREWYAQNLEEQRRKARERMAAKLQDPEYRKIHSEQTKQSNRRRRAEVGRVSRSGLHIPPHLYNHGLRSVDLQAFVDAGWVLSAIDPATVSESRNLWLHLKNTAPAPTVAELVKKQALRDNAANPEKAEFLENGGTDDEWPKEAARRRHHIKMASDPDYVLYHRQKSRRRKAQMRDSVAIQVTGRQIRARFAEFRHQCAYCGATGDLQIEHVLPISKHGGHAIGNIVPACQRCNYSKTNHEAETWYRQQPFFTECRWRKICQVLGWHRSSVGQLALL